MRKKQSTRHIVMIEPGEFYANPETMDTNHYQIDEHEAIPEVTRRAIAEFRGLRDTLVEAGVLVTTWKGHRTCPDHVFPNWFSTHSDGGYVLYPMVNENRRAERSEEMIESLEKGYRLRLDLREFESQGRALESNGSLCQDRINNKVFSALSRRTDPELAEKWARETGYELVLFETRSHTGKPVYHVDIVMFIGTGYAGVCMEAILPEYHGLVRAALDGLEVVELTMDQMKHFAGNSLELLGHDNEKILVMSGTACRALRDDQKERLLKHVTKIVWSDIPTIETYGGGSARCMIQELY